MSGKGIEERFVGSMMGVAVGDALGAPVENIGKAELAMRFGVVKDMLGGGWLGLAPGEVTNDTQMTLALAESLAARGGFVAEDVARSYVEWFLTHPKDIGLTINCSLALLESGEKSELASEIARQVSMGDGVDNGTLMRCAPIAMMDFEDEDRLAQDTLAESRITHSESLAGEAALAHNRMVAEALGGKKDKQAIVGTAAAYMERYNGQVSSLLAGVPGEPIETVESTTSCLDTLKVSAWAFSKTDSFEEALIFAVNLGGDADTAGAVTGALVGAYYGAGEIPGRWRKKIRGAKRIKELAHAMYTLARGKAGCGQ